MAVAEPNEVMLSSTERRILQGHAFFLEKPYDCKDKKNHSVTQNMVYFLQQYGWMHTGFHFKLGQDGVHSDDLEDFLQEMDTKEELVTAYQKESKADELSLRDWKIVTHLHDRVDIGTGKDTEQWMKALAVLTYFAIVLFPDWEFPLIADRVAKRYGFTVEYLQEAWNVL